MSISAGGYVRSVAHELGQDLGCGAHLSSLRRTQAGVFTLAEAHTLDELQPLAGNVEALEALVHPSAQPAAGDALGYRRCDGPGTAAQRRAGQSAGVFPGAAGEGLRRTAGVGGHCQARGGNALSAGGGNGVRQGSGNRDQGAGNSTM